MHGTMRVALSLGLLLPVGPAQGQDSLYRIRSRDMAITAFDLTVTETKRTPRTSLLRIPGFHGGSGAASRWLMCVYSHLAFRRGFKYWAAVYPERPSEDVLVGFPDTDTEDVSRTLGPEFVEDRMLPPQSVEWFAASFCGKLDEWPKGVAAPAAAEEPPYVAAMKADLRMLVLAEERFFADSLRYGSRIGPTGVNFQPREGNTVLSLQLTADGWAARIGNPKTQTVCTIYVGSTPLAPATTEGMPTCK